MKNYETILFDADNTLFDFNKAERTAIAETFENFNVKVTDKIIDDYHKINDDYWKRLEKKEVTEQQLNYMRFDDLFAMHNLNLNSTEFNLAYKDNLANQSFLIEGALDIVKYLFGLSKKLIIASNGSKSIQNSRISRSPLSTYVSAVYTSQDAGYPKPSKEFFDKTFALFNLDKATTLLVGDSITADIKGGFEYGIDTVYFAPNGDRNPMPTYTITSLSELKNIIK